MIKPLFIIIIYKRSAPPIPPIKEDSNESIFLYMARLIVRFLPYLVSIMWTQNIYDPINIAASIDSLEYLINNIRRMDVTLNRLLISPTVPNDTDLQAILDEA